MTHVRSIFCALLIFLTRSLSIKVIVWYSYLKIIFITKYNEHKLATAPEVERCTEFCAQESYTAEKIVPFPFESST